MSDWIAFEDRGRSFQPKVTVSANGYIAFNEGACTRFGIKEFAAVKLHYSPSTARIGIELLTEGSGAGARKVRPRDMGADFSAGPFLDRFDIRPKTTSRYDLTRDEDTDFLVIELRKGKLRKKGSRSKEELDEQEA